MRWREICQVKPKWVLAIFNNVSHIIQYKSDYIFGMNLFICSAAIQTFRLSFYYGQSNARVIWISERDEELLKRFLFRCSFISHSFRMCACVCVPKCKCIEAAATCRLFDSLSQKSTTFFSQHIHTVSAVEFLIKFLLCIVATVSAENKTEFCLDTKRRTEFSVCLIFYLFTWKHFLCVFFSQWQSFKWSREFETKRGKSKKKRKFSK